MFQPKHLQIASKTDIYHLLKKEMKSLFSTERDFIANAANLSALLYHTLPDLNWAGFYIKRSDELVLGPFQGKPACVRIPMGQGVCGTVAKRMETVIVSNVHQFPGHIACDQASNAEIVVPIIQENTLIAVLDLDSPKPDRFDQEDKKGLENIITQFVKHTHIQT